MDLPSALKSYAWKVIEPQFGVGALQVFAQPGKTQEANIGPNYTSLEAIEANIRKGESKNDPIEKTANWNR